MGPGVRGVSRGGGGGKRGELPGRTRNPTSCFNCATEDDEFHAVDHGGGGRSANEGLNEALDCVHSEVLPKVLWRQICGEREEKNDGKPL